jgi:hypothetical protein
MAPETGTALLIIVLFVLPGFVTLLIRERTHTIRGEDTPFERLLNALYYSALIYVIAVVIGLALGLDKSDLVAFYNGEKSLGEDLTLALLIALVLPAVLSELGLLWRKSRLRPRVLRCLRISPAHTVSSAWNEAFGRGGTPMVRATLTDGRVVGGYFGFGSLAGYSEHTPDLFIVERWVLDGDGWFKKPAEDTDGVWIGHESIASVEFYKVPDQEEAGPSQTELQLKQ